MQLHPELNTGDSGSIDGQDRGDVSFNSNKNDITTGHNTTILASIPEEISEKSSFITTQERNIEELKGEPEPNQLVDTADELVSRMRSALTSGNTSLQNAQQPRAVQPQSATLNEVRKRMRVGERKPYERCITQLNMLGSRGGIMTPFEKMQCIAEISSGIRDDVQEFWKGVDVEQRKLTLDAEQIAMIYEYVAIKADVTNIFAQIRFCREFSTKFIRNMKQGFCLVTLEMALNQLIEFPELIGA